MGKLKINKLIEKKGLEPIVCITAYDYPSGRVVDDADVDLILVGDSLGMVVQGHDNTLSVTMDQMIYHSEMVSRAVEKAFVITDLPFMSYQADVAEGIRNAGRLVQEGRVQGVKLEGATENAKAIIKSLSEIGVPVMGHIGYTPQSAHGYGSKFVQGRNIADAQSLILQAIELENAGVFAIVLEMIPYETAVAITEVCQIPTIGIGSGVGCDGQIIVLHDLLGDYYGYSPRFVRPLANIKETSTEAVKKYVKQVREKDFPGDKESVFVDEDAATKIAEFVKRLRGEST